MPIAAGLFYSVHEGGTRDKPPLVLIHGAGGNHLSWSSDLRRMPGRRVFALDLPGHGRSAGAGQHSIASYAGHIVNFLAGLGIHQAVFAGHSMGGSIALCLALDYPTNVAGLALISSGAHLDVPAAILSDAASPVTYSKAVEGLCGAVFSPQSSPALVTAAVDSIARTRPGVLYADFQACRGFDVPQRVCEVKAPTLVVCGAEDRLAPPSCSAFLAASITGAELVMVPGAGHMLPLEQPAALRAALQGFLNRLM